MKTATVLLLCAASCQASMMIPDQRLGFILARDITLDTPTELWPDQLIDDRRVGPVVHRNMLGPLTVTGYFDQSELRLHYLNRLEVSAEWTSTEPVTLTIELGDVTRAHTFDAGQQQAETVLYALSDEMRPDTPFLVALASPGELMVRSLAWQPGFTIPEPTGWLLLVQLTLLCQSKWRTRAREW